jgi:hypothetical protein
MSSRSALALAWFTVASIFFAISSLLSRARVERPKPEKDNHVLSVSIRLAPLASMSAFCVAN